MDAIFHPVIYIGCSICLTGVVRLHGFIVLSVLDLYKTLSKVKLY